MIGAERCGFVQKVAEESGKCFVLLDVLICFLLALFLLSKSGLMERRISAPIFR